LIVLWYAGLAVTVILLNRAIDFRATNDSSHVYLVSIIVVLASLLIFTLKPHPAASKAKVFAAVFVPLLGVPLLVFGGSRLADVLKQRTILPSEIEFTNPVLTYELGTPRFVAQVRNRSSHLLTGLKLEIAITEGNDVIERVTTDLYLKVPPGELREVNDNLPRTATTLYVDGQWSPKYKWSYRIVSLEGRVPDPH